LVSSCIQNRFVLIWRGMVAAVGQILSLPAWLDKSIVQNCVSAFTVSEMNTWIRRYITCGSQERFEFKGFPSSVDCAQENTGFPSSVDCAQENTGFPSSVDCAQENTGDWQKRTSEVLLPLFEIPSQYWYTATNRLTVF